MKLIRATFENFRLLRDLSIDFSVDPKKNLTVIRAANESGKTTILHALQWALYGDDSLPKKGKGFRLSPINYELTDGNNVEIRTTVDFEVTRYNPVGRKSVESRQVYRIVRSVTENVDNPDTRPPSTVSLFELSDEGLTPILHERSIVDREVPPNLREVFFTDGDRALSFIEGSVSQSAKRERVEGAIRSLLGLDVLKNAIDHIRKSERNINAKAKEIGVGGQLETITTNLIEIDKNISKDEKILADAKVQFSNVKKELNKVSEQIEEILKKGDQEKLTKQLSGVKVERKQTDEESKQIQRDHSELFRSPAMARRLLVEALRPVRDSLDALYQEGKIPSTTIPVLQERLSLAVCICGEGLDPANDEGKRRRSHIQKLIDDSKQSDKVQEIVTSLYYFYQDDGNTSWRESYERISVNREKIQMRLEELGRQEREINDAIDNLRNTDIQKLRKLERLHKEKSFEYNTQIAKSETTLENLRRDKDTLEGQCKKELNAQKKGKRILADKDVIQDAKQILQWSRDHLSSTEIGKVSNQMNELFLEMIGADSEQKAIIQRAEVTEEFDILVYGEKGRELDPDRDLNGASRRALTLAFILSLTKVSEVVAPNVIDTPLGMTSGFVRRAILSTAVEHSYQIVLLLTHDEIAGCEKILDKRAGKSCTLTNTAHYPTMLINDPRVDVHRVMRCDCSYNESCETCERKSEL